MSAATPPSSSRSSRFRILFIVLVAVAALIAWWLWPAANNPEQPAPGGQEPVPVRAAVAREANFPVNLTALGTVTAFNTANVRARVDGLLTEIRFEEGQRVKAGDVLAVIDPRPYEVALQQAEGTLQENRAQLKNAQIDYDRYKGLFAQDSIARQTLDTQEALVAQYQGTIRANQAAVAQAKLDLQFTRVSAPIAGRVGLRQVDVGNLVAAGDTTPLAVITETQPISIAFTLPESDLPKVLKARREQSALVVEAWDRGERNRLAQGVLQSIDNQIDLTTGTVRLKARFDNEDESLFPNQFVNVRLQVQTIANATLLPSDAIQYGSIGTFVYVIGEGDKVEVRKVDVGPTDGPNIVVESGVKTGERVAVQGTEQLREGSQVEVIEDAEPGKTVPAPLQNRQA
ncbi:MdtA/MuxA family multidrug efflux RND transporter periplasmic adaptor subunit [Pseudomonas matsuisoli]|uniref:MdtA/MuxA family multidrug efflux RND transporter periplasmic adaptor subunit n=1 Tax=Pseudomonas matsuisoli TaxID=1515666 RepID=UPI001662AFE9|nr:MdtA/MuxA family multidrug efflux RND transporter periplasmic adaptor subunit [Pseudomonas matsuisoli]